MVALVAGLGALSLLVEDLGHPGGGIEFAVGDEVLVEGVDDGVAIAAAGERLGSVSWTRPAISDCTNGRMPPKE